MLRRLLVVLGVLVAAVAAALVLALLNLETLVNQYRDDMAATLGEALGRPVLFGPVRITWAEGLTAEFTSATLVGRAEEDLPQAEVKNVAFKLDVWKMLKTKGRKLEFSKVTILRPRLHLRRDEDGGWDFEDIFRTVSQKAQVETEQAPKDLEAANAWMQGLEIAGLAIQDGTVLVEDALNQRKLVVEGVNLDVSRIIPGKNVGGTLRLVLDDGLTRAPVRAELQLKPLPLNLDFEEIPSTTALLEVENMNLGTWGDLVPAEFTRPEAGTLDVHLDARTDQDSQRGRFQGRVELHGLELGCKGVRGQSSDAELKVDVEANLRTQALQVHHLDLTGPGLELTTRLELTDRSVQGIKHAAVDLKVADLGRLTEVAPQGSALLPKELRLKGPFQVKVQGDADNGNVVINLDDAQVGWGDAVDKAAGVPLRLDVDAVRDARGVDLKDIRLRLQDALVQGHLHVPEKKGAPVTADLRSGDVVLGQLAGIFPAAVDARGQGDKLDGTVRLHLTAAEKHGQQALHAEVALAGMDVRVPRATVQGDGFLVVDMTPTGQKSHEWTGDLKATDLAVRYSAEDGTDLVTKPRGLPTEVHAMGARDGSSMRMDDADIKFGQTAVGFTGTWTGLDTKEESMTMVTDRFDLAFDDLRAVSPAAQVLPPGGTAHAKVRVTRGAQGMRSLKVDVQDLDVDVGRSAVNGSVHLEDLTKPELSVNPTKVDLDLTELRKLTGRTEIPEGRLRATVQAAYDGAHRERFLLRLEDLDASVAGSRVTGTARVQDLAAPDLEVRLAADKVDVAAVQRLFPPSKDPPRPAENPHGLAKGQRGDLRKLKGSVAVKAGSVTYRAYVFRDVEAALKIAEGVVTAEKLDWKVYDGECNAGGSSVDASGEFLRSHLALAVRGLDLRQAVDAHASRPGRVAGKVDAQADLLAAGLDAEDVLGSLRGPVRLHSGQVDVRGLNLLGEMVARLRKSVPLPQPPSGELLDPNRPEAFRNLDVQAAVGERKLVFSRPVTTDTEFGQLQLSGTVFLDSRLELQGGAQLRPEVVRKTTGITPPKAVLVPVKIGGTWSDPELAGVDVEAFARELGLGRLVGTVNDALEGVQDTAEEAKRRADQAKANVDQAAAGARQQAQDAKEDVAEAAAEARQQAQEAKDDVDQAAAAARQQAQEAKEDVDQAAAEARHKADQAREEVERKAEAARQDVEDKARQAKENARKALEEFLP